MTRSTPHIAFRWIAAHTLSHLAAKTLKRIHSVSKCCNSIICLIGKSAVEAVVPCQTLELQAHNPTAGLLLSQISIVLRVSQCVTDRSQGNTQLCSIPFAIPCAHRHTHPTASHPTLPRHEQCPATRHAFTSTDMTPAPRPQLCHQHEPVATALCDHARPPPPPTCHPVSARANPNPYAAPAVTQQA